MRMKGRDIILLLLTALLIAAFSGYILTRGTASPQPSNAAGKAGSAPAKLVDQSPLQTAYDLAPVATTAAEQKFASEAARLADREVDMAFVSALQVAELHPPVENAATKELNARIHNLDNRLQSVQQNVSRLTPLAANAENKDNHALQQALEVVQARAALLEDALADAREDLVRAGGDPQAEIKKELEEHDALQHGTGAPTVTPPSKPAAFSVAGNLLSQFQTWQRLRGNRVRLLQAQQQASTYAALLTHKHEALAKGMTDVLGDDVDIFRPEQFRVGITPQNAATVSQLQGFSKDSKLMAQYDKRIQAEQQLASLYGSWGATVEEQVRIALHGILRSVLLILLALIGIVLAEGFIEHFYAETGPDRRRLGTMRLVLRFISQLIGVMVILLVVFGPPSQLSTVLALGAAGLTVALKDFIVAFFGWFILMGRHGIRAGDWVEINGIGGEVVEVGLLRTILLETGNWNDAGHPTGRKVSFVNSYAIERHYFNFTTAGQWLWDELDVLIPAGEDPYYLTNSVLKLVSEQTQADAASAEEEWRRVVSRSAIQTFSAAPAINVRPTNLGVNLVVRYVVNAHNRYEVRTRLYQAIVELLHGAKSAAAVEKQLPARS